MIVNELKLALGVRDMSFVREQFRALVGYPSEADIEAENADQLVDALEICIDALFNDTAIMPRDTCAALDLPLGADYSDGAAQAWGMRPKLRAPFDAAFAPNEETTSLFEWVKAALLRQGVKASAVVSGARFVEDLNLDSLDLVELLMWAEDDFGEIDDATAEGVKTVEGAVRLLRSVRAQASQKAEAGDVRG